MVATLNILVSARLRQNLPNHVLFDVDNLPVAQNVYWEKLQHPPNVSVCARPLRDEDPLSGIP